jgi:hypothetical protein
MKRIKLRAGFTIFILFFGISLLEAFRTKNWVAAAFWVTLAVVFLLLDNQKDQAN